MKAKIKWYQEVLELEPSSKVFFPLARLFAEEDQYAEAVATLKQGLEQHPEHLEARMLLIECLEKLHAREKLSSEVEALGSMLSKYPGFWKAWAGALAAEPDTRDASMAMRFLAAAFGAESVSWASVIEQGLAGLLGDNDFLAPVSAVPEDSGELPAAAGIDAEVLDEASAEASEASDDALAEEIPLSLAQMNESAHISPLYVDSDESEDDGTDSEEQFSLRTLSMAEVLATQGDTKQALEICDELSGETENAEELAKIAEARETILAAGSGSAAESDKPLEGKSKLINTLETLAERLEARAAK